MCGPTDTGMLAAPVPPIAQRPAPTSAMGSFAQCCDPSPNDPAIPAHLYGRGPGTSRYGLARDQATDSAPNGAHLVGHVRRCADVRG